MHAKGNSRQKVVKEKCILCTFDCFHSLMQQGMYPVTACPANSYRCVNAFDSVNSRLRSKSAIQDSQLTCLQPCLLPLQMQLGCYLLFQQRGQSWAGHIHNNCKIADCKGGACIWQAWHRYNLNVCLLMLGNHMFHTRYWLDAVNDV